MGEMPLVSIIVPIYNMEKYLQKALDSAINQTYENIELILVDDGSTDKSLFICEEHARKDNRVKVIHINNSGVSIARNLGIKEAKGKYIQFMDPDDFYEYEITEKLVNIAESNNFDLVICAINLLTIKNKVVVKNIKKRIGQTGIYKGIDLIKLSLFSNEITAGCIGTPVNKLYSVKLLKENYIYYNEKIIVNEDEIFNITHLLHCKKVYYLDEMLYNQFIYDRITGSNRYWPNAYEDSKYLYSIYKKAMFDLSENEKFMLSNWLANKIITAVVILCRADTTYSKKQLLNKLKKVINDEEVQNALKYYKRKSSKHSFFIPFFIKLKMPRNLMFVAKRRAEMRYGALIKRGN